MRRQPTTFHRPQAGGDAYTPRKGEFHIGSFDDRNIAGANPPNPARCKKAEWAELRKMPAVADMCERGVLEAQVSGNEVIVTNFDRGPISLRIASQTPKAPSYEQQRQEARREFAQDVADILRGAKPVEAGA